MNIGLQCYCGGRRTITKVAYSIIVYLKTQLHLRERIEEGEQGILLSAMQVEIAFGKICCNRQGNGFVAIAQELVAGGMQPLHTIDYDTPIDLDFDDRTHLLQELDQVDNFWLEGRVLDNGDTLCQRGGDKKILGRHDTGERQFDRPAVKTPGRAEMVAPISFHNFGCHLTQASDMDV